MVAELPEKAVQAAAWAAWISDPAFRERQNPAKRPGFCLGVQQSGRLIAFIMSPEFLITSFVIVASPGTGALYTIATGLARGRRPSLLAAFACTLGILPHLVAAMLGLAALLHASALAYDSVKYAGVAYLLYMAWQTLRDRGAMRIDTDATPKSVLRILRDGVLLNVLNPKLSIFFVAFLPSLLWLTPRSRLSECLNYQPSHDDDLHCIRHIRNFRRSHARSSHCQASYYGTASPGVCGCFRRAWCEARSAGVARTKRSTIPGLIASAAPRYTPSNSIPPSPSRN